MAYSMCQRRREKNTKKGGKHSQELISWRWNPRNQKHLQSEQSEVSPSTCPHQNKEASLPEIQLGTVMKFVIMLDRQWDCLLNLQKPLFSSLITCATLLSGTQISFTGGEQKHATELVPEWQPLSSAGVPEN